MLIPIILTIGCITFLCIGTALASWAGIEMGEEGPDIKNIIMFIFGIAVAVFACFCIVESSEHCHKKEFTTSVPAQVDTIIIIKNSIPDTLYTYHYTPYTYHLTKEK